MINQPTLFVPPTRERFAATTAGVVTTLAAMSTLVAVDAHALVAAVCVLITLAAGGLAGLRLSERFLSR